ncbi:carbohydrate ABC transporter permease [Streptobacillus ratti]|uniref:carbohydrate ABC transporter permease n=1 Tax=Streptobacillus ratti TaxID=1720557 RepID=UPI00093524C8|nr:carbohydrate ABC transporter permease [Streptobacillus ratti]
MNKKRMSAETLYKLFIYIALITFAISIIVPVSWVFLASLKQNSEFVGSPWKLPLGFYYQNFIDAFINAKMGDYLFNSIYVTTLALILLIIVALPASYVLARMEFIGRNFWTTFMKAGLFINVNYIVIPIFLMLLDGDKFLRKNEIIKKAFFLDNMTMLATIYMSTALPFTIYLLTNFFQSISKTYEEAAYIDGAGYFITMVKVIAPMARPSIITVILFNFLAFWNEYIIALTLLPGTQKTLPVGLMTLMAASRGAANYGRLYAGMVIVMLPTLILYIIVQQKLTEGMSAGGSKE